MINNNIHALKQPPAIAMPLQGRHLIEASAGTGKTWTLTGVVLRLLVEAGYPCHQIIATTFTRSAAAEMRQRILERLQNMYQLLYMINGISFAESVSQQDVLEQKIDEMMTFIAHKSEQQGLADIFADPVNQYIIRWIAKQIFSNAGKNYRNTVDFYVALQRVKVAINQLDQLFVGTLDSLCKKWLQEFSTDTGYSADIQIANDVSAVIRYMVHDQLRAFWTQVYQQEPKIYQSIAEPHKFLTVDECIKAVNKALNFYSTPIDNVLVEPIKDIDNILQVIQQQDIKAEIVKHRDMDNVWQLMQRIADFQDDNFALYFDDDYRKQQGFSSANKLTKRFSFFKDLQQAFQVVNLDTLLDLDTSLHELMEAIAELIDNDKGFNKKFDQQKADFLAFSVVQDIYQLYHLRQPIMQEKKQIEQRLKEHKQQLEQHQQHLKQYFIQFISRYVRDNLSQVLEAQRLTTFGLQLARLNQALSGEQGEMLARYIRHQYPVALIDESQDINTEQAWLIQRIYLHDDKQSLDKNRHQTLFLLLVGDPKQAIYGFRGGDVHNYTVLKKMFPQKPMQLLENRRSAQAFIHALNGWYGVDETQSIDNSENNQSTRNYLGNEIFYHKMVAVREQAELTLANHHQPLPTFYHLNVGYQQANPNADSTTDTPQQSDFLDYDDVIAGQILAWFDPDNPEQLLLNGKKLSLNDICVLAYAQHELDKVEKKLHQCGIATIRGGSKNVFTDKMANDLLALMSVLLNPYHQSKLKTIFISHFFQLTLTQTNQLFDNPQQAELLDIIQQIFIKANEKWQKNGFLSAMQWLLNQKFALPNQQLQNFWQRLASHQQGERLLIDLRQLLDIIGEQSSLKSFGEYQLYDWYVSQIQESTKDEWALQQRLPSETGVELMTIHKSKGLEFNIVFVVGLDKSVQDKDKLLFLYSTENTVKNPLANRRLSATPQNQATGKNFQEIQLNNLFEERLRLMYVAFTRAKERLYLVTVGSIKERKMTPLTAFVNDSKSMILLPAVANFVSTVEINSLSKYLQKNQKITKQSQNIATNLDTHHYQNAITHINTKSFIGWGSTSFTALRNYVDYSQYDRAVHEPEYDGLVDESDVNYRHDEMLNSKNLVDNDLAMRFRFERGEKAGIFLHKVLEDLVNQSAFKTIDSNDFDNWQPPKHWSVMINRALQQQKLPEHYFSSKDDNMNHEYLALARWINDIIHTPLLATGQRLVDMKQRPKLAEMGFNMRLKQNMSAKKLNQLFQSYKIDLCLQEDMPQRAILKYLRGEIDLVYQHDNRFYIVDYKSNHLGNQLSDYHQYTLQQEMTKHSYWLQASIYQVALHRFLQLRLPKYDIYQHLGQVEYAFLRGMSPYESSSGKITCNFAPSFILALDELFS